MINVTQTFLPPLDEYVAQLQRIWESKWLTNRGALVLELEEKLRDYLGVTNLLAVNNGTIALQIAIKALGLTGEIITTPFSYVATVSSIVWENCTPVFVDIDPDYLTIDENLIEAAITDNTSAILATHVYGNPCNVEAIEVIAKRHNLNVIYDAAHCFGVKYKGRSVLNWGDVSTLSFHATKLFHTGEGGAIICNDPELADRIFYHHNFGHNGPEHFHGLGVNGKVSELNAAMGLAVFDHIEEVIAARRTAFETYVGLLPKNKVRLLDLREQTEWNYSYLPVIFSDQDSLNRVMSALNAKSIFPRRYFYPSLNRLPYLMENSVPVAEDISSRVMCLPFSAAISSEEIHSISSILIDNV